MKDEASKTVESVKSVKSVINKNTDRTEPTDRTIKPSLLDIEISAKTFVIAHSSILLVGLIICFGLYYYLYRTESLSQIKNLAPLTQAPKSFILEINNPEDDDLVFDKSLVVSGKTQPNISVLISVDAVDFALESNNRGDFSKIVTLNSGANLIEISAIDKQGNSKTLQRSVFYSEEKI